MSATTDGFGETEAALLAMRHATAAVSSATLQLNSIKIQTQACIARSRQLLEETASLVQPAGRLGHGLAA